MGMVWVGVGCSQCHRGNILLGLGVHSATALGEEVTGEGQLLALKH